jgi:hypothetical protein
MTDERRRRFMQVSIFAINTKSKGPDLNFFTYPLPVVSIINATEGKVIRIHELSTDSDNIASLSGTILRRRSGPSRWYSCESVERHLPA